MIRNRERQARHNNVREGSARHIHPGPEAVGSQQDAPLVIAELLQEAVPGITPALHEKPPVLLMTNVFQGIGSHLQAAITGKEHEGPSVTAVEEMFNPPHKGLLILRGLRIGHGLYHVYFHLLAVIKGAANPERFHLLRPDPPPEIAQPGITRAQGRAGQDRGPALRKQDRPQAPGHIDRGGPHGVGTAVRSASLHPVDAPPVLLPKKDLQGCVSLPQPSRAFLDLGATRLIFGLVRESVQISPELPQRSRQGIRHDLRFAHPEFPPPLTEFADLSQQAKELLSFRESPLDPGHGFAHPQGSQ